MEHKAFLFDYYAFQKELTPILVEALEKKENDPIISFIERNRKYLTDPYDGEPLDENWKELIEFGTPEEYGDYALTKYYNVQEEIGLGESWATLDDFLKNTSRSLSATLLGTPLGRKGLYFDPGKMGSYFQSPGDVVQNIEILKNLEQNPLVNMSLLRLAEDLLINAIKAGKGLYVTF